MLIAILLGIGIGALAAMIVHFVVLGLKHIIEKVKKSRAKKVVVKRARELLAEAMKDVKNEQEAMSIKDLEELLDNDRSFVVADINEKNEIEVRDINIWESERKVEDPLNNVMNQNNGTLLINAA